MGLFFEVLDKLIEAGGMTAHQHGRRGRRLVIYSRGRRGTTITEDCAPPKAEEVGRLIRRWQLRVEARGERFEGFRLRKG
jgi:hypothetical protein